jgi:predicted Rossmann fold flavoprotein
MSRPAPFRARLRSHPAAGDDWHDNRAGAVKSAQAKEDMFPMWDVIVIGAGAAGLLAAIRAAEAGRRALVLEKNLRPGVKILMSGGTRCNLTHATDERGIVAAFGSQGPFLHSALATLGPDQLVELFHREGVSTKVEPGGKVFPESNRAADVVAALSRRLARSGAHVSLGEPVRSLTPGAECIEAVTSRQAILGRNVIVTTGGQSYPGCGTTGDAYDWARQLGHTVVAPRPALTPVLAAVPWVEELSGVTVSDARVSVVPATRASASSSEQSAARRKADRSTPATARGSLLFTHFGLSGPAVLDVSRAVSGAADPQSLALCCDFLPAESEDEFIRWLDAQCAAGGGRQIDTVVAERLPRRLSQTLLALVAVPAERRAAEVSRADRRRLGEAVKRCLIPVRGVMGFRKAEVTAGGVDLREVDSRTMQSKLVPGLFFAGEVLDLDGPIGGYNFQAAFSTGWLAGSSACRSEPSGTRC